MASNKIAYGGDTSITLSTAAPTDGSDATSSSAIDNSTNLFFDALVGIQVTAAGSGTSATGYMSVYVQPSTDGTNYNDSANDILIGTLNVISNSASYVGVFSVAQACGGVMPRNWKLRIRNSTGGTVSGLTAHYNGVYATVV